MPKQVTWITDDDLKIRLRQLDDGLLITAKQAAAVLTRSVSSLEEARKLEGPPPYVKLGDKPKSQVRYTIGAIKKHLDDLGRGYGNASPAAAPLLSVAEQNAQKRAQRLIGGSFAAFVSEGHADDEYPFTKWNGRLIDFFDSLTMNVDDSAECLIYTLEEYLTERLNQARHEQAEELHETLKREKKVIEVRPKSTVPKSKKRL